MIVQSTIIIVVVCCFVVLRSKTKGFKQKYSNKRSTIMVFQGKTIISLWDIMVRSFGSNNCSIRRIQPWFDPFSNLSRSFCQRSNNYIPESLFILFHRFFLKKKKGQKKAGTGQISWFSFGKQLYPEGISCEKGKYLSL